MFDTLERLPINTMAASLDAATALSFDLLRVRGRNADWGQVMANLERLSQLKKHKGFDFTISMTLNSVNAFEIEEFVDLAINIDAEPLITLVANPHQTVEFQRKFLTFTAEQFKEMKRQIEVSLPKVRELRHKDASLYLEQLMTHLDIHRALDNNPAYFSAKNLARKVYRQLPEQMQSPIRRVVQERRRSRLEREKA